ncbi:hypothetical protein [Clostridium butyricum]|nr:hypothetical protein [Clostridium butyricum]
MDSFIQALLILSVFLGFIFAVFCGYQIRIKDKDREFSASKDSDNNKEK